MARQVALYMDGKVDGGMFLEWNLPGRNTNLINVHTLISLNLALENTTKNAYYVVFY